MAAPWHPGSLAMLQAIRAAGEHGMVLSHVLRQDTTDRTEDAKRSAVWGMCRRKFLKPIYAEKGPMRLVACEPPPPKVYPSPKAKPKVSIVPAASCARIDVNVPNSVFALGKVL